MDARYDDLANIIDPKGPFPEGLPPRPSRSTEAWVSDDVDPEGPFPDGSPRPSRSVKDARFDDLATVISPKTRSQKGYRHG